MKINKVSLEFSNEEIESIHYAMEIGIRSYKRNKSKCADDWIEKAKEIRQMLPTQLHLQDLRSDR